MWQLLDNHFDEFEYRFDDLFSREYGFFRPEISHIVRKYLEGGDLDQGLGVSLRIACLPIMCGEANALGVYSKKVVQFSSHLQDNVLFPVPHRQYVVIILKIIRRYFFYDRKLLGKLSQ
ncbi:MAG: hypothetical protein V2B20_18895 [Pseudomonadota bacterium]